MPSRKSGSLETRHRRIPIETKGTPAKFFDFKYQELIQGLKDEIQNDGFYVDIETYLADDHSLMLQLHPRGVEIKGIIPLSGPNEDDKAGAAELKRFIRDWKKSDIRSVLKKKKKEKKAQTRSRACIIQ